MVKIRPHHSLCAQFFVGKGYSEQFVRHMTRVLADLKREGALVTLTDGCDELCSCCPNNQNGVCETDAKVRSIDRRVMDAVGLSYGDTLPWRELCAMAERKIIAPGKLRETCADCEWIGLCAGGLEE